jgi:Skp family chaperone for outer membrane proteins
VKHLAFTLATIGLALSSFAIAQAQEQAPAPGQERAEALAQVLNLSPQQQSQLAPILKTERPKVQAVLQDPNLTPSEKKSKLKHIHAQTDPLVQSILNPTQYQQWQTIRKDELENLGLKK